MINSKVWKGRPPRGPWWLSADLLPNDKLWVNKPGGYSLSHLYNFRQEYPSMWDSWRLETNLYDLVVTVVRTTLWSMITHDYPPSSSILLSSLILFLPHQHLLRSAASRVHRVTRVRVGEPEWGEFRLHAHRSHVCHYNPLSSAKKLIITKFLMTFWHSASAIIERHLPCLTLWLWLLEVF